MSEISKGINNLIRHGESGDSLTIIDSSTDPNLVTVEEVIKVGHAKCPDPCRTMRNMSVGVFEFCPSCGAPEVDLRPAMKSFDEDAIEAPRASSGWTLKVLDRDGERTLTSIPSADAAKNRARELKRRSNDSRISFRILDPQGAGYQHTEPNGGRRLRWFWSGAV